MVSESLKLGVINLIYIFYVIFVWEQAFGQLCWFAWSCSIFCCSKLRSKLLKTTTFVDPKSKNCHHSIFFAKTHYYYTNNLQNTLIALLKSSWNLKSAYALFSRTERPAPGRSISLACGAGATWSEARRCATPAPCLPPHVDAGIKCVHTSPIK